MQQFNEEAGLNSLEEEGEVGGRRTGEGEEVSVSQLQLILYNSFCQGGGVGAYDNFEEEAGAKV